MRAYASVGQAEADGNAPEVDADEANAARTTASLRPMLLEMSSTLRVVWYANVAVLLLVVVLVVLGWQGGSAQQAAGHRYVGEAHGNSNSVVVAPPLAPQQPYQPPPQQPYQPQPQQPPQPQPPPQPQQPPPQPQQPPPQPQQPPPQPQQPPPQPQQPPPPDTSLVLPEGLTPALLDRCRGVDIIGAKMKGRPLPEPLCNDIPWMEPVMKPRDKETIFRYVRNARTYVEYGSGGSSNTVALLPERSMTIEHVVAWCDKVAQHPMVARNVELGRQAVKCIETGLELRAWGKPNCGSLSKEDCGKKFLPYINAIDEFGEDTIDVILVDGRLRRSCALKALGHMSSSSILLVHDIQRYTDKLSPFFDLVERVEKVGVYRAKPHLVGNTDLYLQYLTEFLK